MKKLITIIIPLIFFFTNSNATHLMGGEITWKCLGNGNFIFQMKVYRDCATPVYITNSGPIVLRVHNHPTVSAIPMSIVDSADISPQCNAAGPSFNCSTLSPGNTATKEYLLESAPVYLPGVPPAQGWIFTWTNCCRNAAITNLSLTFSGPGNPNNGFTLRAKMFPYNGQANNSCFDSAPVFLESPQINLCAGSPLIYSAGAYDADGDSLSFEFDHPLDYLAATDSFTATIPAEIPFEIGYSYTSPFPGAAQNANNIPASLNPLTGEMTFTSYNVGNFVLTIKVSTFKCGQKVAEIYREIQTVIVNCPPNLPPTTNAPFADNTGIFNSYIDTVEAGELVSFSLTGFDNGFLPIGIQQSIGLQPVGIQFGTNFIDSISGCEQPPCATLSSPPPYIGLDSLKANFRWQTACHHVLTQPNCPKDYTTYNFLFRFSDDYCAVPSSAVRIVSIVVKKISNSIPVISFSGDTLHSSPGFDYQWFLNGIALQSDTLQHLIPALDGNYVVMVTDSNGCDNSSIPYLITIPSSVSNSHKEIHFFEIFPNPANEVFSIRSAEKILNINAYNLAGERTVLLPINNTVDISMLAGGFYLIEINGLVHKEMIKLVKI